MLQLHCYIDDDGHPRAELAPPHELLGWFLEVEVGLDRLLVRRMIADIDSAMGAPPGQLVEGQTPESHWWLGENARLRYRHLDPPQEVELSLIALRFVLDRWAALLDEL